MQFRLTKTGFFALAIAPSLFSISEAREPDNIGEFRLEAIPSVALDASSASVEFSLEYIGSSAIEVSVENLPGERLFRFVALYARSFPRFELDPFVICPQPKERIFIDDPGVGLKTILPGEKLTQSIDLFQLYDNFGEILGKCDFVMHWSHKIYPDGPFTVPRTAGSVVITAEMKVVGSDVVISKIYHAR